MHILNKTFNMEQSGTHPKGVQLAQLAIFGSPSCFTPLVYIDPKV